MATGTPMDESTRRSCGRANGVRAVALELAILAATAALQTVVFAVAVSRALLADLIHNGGDALTAVPLGIAFWLRSERGEKWAGYAVVLTIFVSATVAAVEAIDRLIHPTRPSRICRSSRSRRIGFIGNEVAAHVRLRAGERLNSPALIADGHHARVDGYVSLGVVIAAVLEAIGIRRADPIVGLVITALPPHHMAGMAHDPSRTRPLAHRAADVSRSGIPRTEQNARLTAPSRLAGGDADRWSDRPPVVYAAKPAFRDTPEASSVTSLYMGLSPAAVRWSRVLAISRQRAICARVPDASSCRG